MKMITKRGIFLWILVFAFVFGLGFLTYSLMTDGSSWVMQPYNSHLYYNGELIGAGKSPTETAEALPKQTTAKENTTIR